MIYIYIIYIYDIYIHMIYDMSRIYIMVYIISTLRAKVVS